MAPCPVRAAHATPTNAPVVAIDALAFARPLTPMTTAASLRGVIDAAAATDATRTRPPIRIHRIARFTGSLLVTSKREPYAELERSRIADGGNRIEARDRVRRVGPGTEGAVARHVVHPIGHIE